MGPATQQQSSQVRQKKTESPQNSPKAIESADSVTM